MERSIGWLLISALVLSASKIDNLRPKLLIESERSDYETR